MRNWMRTKLSEVLEVVHGYAFPSEGMSEELTGKPIIINIGNFDYKGGFRFAATRVREFSGRYPSQFVLIPGDLLVVMTCQTAGGEILGLPGVIPNDGNVYLHNQRIGKVIVDRSKIDVLFAYYCFLSHNVNRQLVATASGTKILHTAPTRIGAVEIDLPPLPYQRAIAAVLAALDDKIAVNDHITHKCNKLRGLRLQYWLQINGELTESSPLASFADFVNGRAFTKDATGTGRMVIRIAEINSGPGGSTVYNDIDVPDVHLARPGDVLFAWSGSLAVTRWYRPEAIVNQHIFKVIPHAGVPDWLVYELILAKLAYFKRIAAGKATTMGHIQRHHLDEHVPAPSHEAVAALDAELGPLWKRALAAEQESLVLAELRDTLLPRLMSGEIRVRDAERVVEDVT
jgi:type I restriction enzyme, S subunit